MIDIKFYQKVYNIKQKLREGIITPQEAYQYFEDARGKVPVVFNIETTNNCNMNCKMCPRPTQMTRPVGTMSMDLFKKIVKQLRPWSYYEWEDWEHFVKEQYHYSEDEMSENNFFLYIVPEVITLHGYGEPLLDKHIAERVAYLSEYSIPSYFSCNPYNITLEKGKALLEADISYLKFSAESLNLFKKAEKTIKKLLSIPGPTVFIIDIVGNEQEYNKLSQMFEGYDVYMYLKSQDNQWYKQTDGKQQSIHWLEPCQFPWSSMSIMWDGSIVPCGQDFNNELVLGNVSDDPLYTIWNSKKYCTFRENHLYKKIKNKCVERCDMKVLGDC